MDSSTGIVQHVQQCWYYVKMIAPPVSMAPLKTYPPIEVYHHFVLIFLMSTIAIQQCSVLCIKKTTTDSNSSSRCSERRSESRVLGRSFHFQRPGGGGRN
ncbi:hypothetical protein BDQ12DRAFT_689247 [Crucibulum laeve]|uniref:Uncharacterized protein n=1 Tax=Crucibulum laeve TaxID=68775 RepID=A0A5C3LPW6_9AGAR|nr:hypothetical protein BDQ12DRAFT_689247 [Crucibulum laeve]